MRKPIESPFNSIEVRVVPENVTTLPKLEPRAADSLFEERDVALKQGETLRDGAARPTARPEPDRRHRQRALGGRPKIGGARRRAADAHPVAPGPRPGEPRQIVRVILFGERGVEAIAATNDRSPFVSVTPPLDESQASRRPQANADDEDGEDEEGGARLYDSLYETALKNELPRQTVEELVRIFGYDVDFQRRGRARRHFRDLLRPGRGKRGERPEVLYAALTVGGEVSAGSIAIRATTARVDFFDEAGRSLKKFLMRKPIAEGILRSGFGSRRHPILGYSKMHTGVDWANRIGTPILAAGNGTVDQGRMGFGLWPPRRGPARQRLRDLLQPHVPLRQAASRPGPGCARARSIGYVGIDRPLDRAAPPLRGHRQRPLRRPDEDPPAARTRARRAARSPSSSASATRSTV